MTSSTPLFFTKCGRYNPETGDATVYSDNSKRHINLNRSPPFYLGIVTTIGDSVITDYSAVNSDFRNGVNENILTRSSKSADVIIRLSDLVVRPSDAIENIHREAVNTLKREYTKHLNTINIGCSRFLEDALRTINLPVSSVGVSTRIQNGDGEESKCHFYNSNGTKFFNIFNSHPILVEAHTDTDVLIMMAIFLKHNGLWWRKGHGLYYEEFDYINTFLKRDYKTESRSFVYEIAGLVPESIPFERKRKIDDCNETTKPAKNFVAAKNLTGVFIDPNGHGICKHDSSSFLSFKGGRIFCLSCFCSLFFVANSNVVFKKKEDLQEWITKTEEEFDDEELVAHFNKLARIDCERRDNEDEEEARLRRDYVFWNLMHSLDLKRIKYLPSMDTRLVFANSNPFGKMLLILMQNCCVMSADGFTEGKWFDVRYRGPNTWKFQITSCKELVFKSLDEMSCIETLRRLPIPGKNGPDIVSRLVIKTYCRGENLASANEIASDISQVVNKICMNLGNRKFFFSDSKLMSAAEVSEEVLVSLEVTGYRPNRAQHNLNSNRVSARVFRLLRAREGAKVWRTGDTILFEDLNRNDTCSQDALERMTALHRVFYYDIETTKNKCSDPHAVITSICGSLCTGGDIDGGERTIFALAGKDEIENDLVKRIKDEYPHKENIPKREWTGKEEDYIVTDYPPDNIFTYNSELELLVGFNEYMERNMPHVICGWNSKNFDDPFIFTRMVQYLYNEKGIYNHDLIKRLSQSGIFNFKQFMRKGKLAPQIYNDIIAEAVAHDNMSYMDQQVARKSKNGGKSSRLNGINSLLGGCCRIMRLDMKELCAKAYENLAEYNLNAVLEKVSKVGDRLRILKDPIDLFKQLLGYMSLATAREQAPVHKYCSKDAYLVGVVDASTNKCGEMRRLCLDSTLIESVVAANMPTPLCISEGAICRSMGAERAKKRGSGIRKHSMATETKGGMVTQPLVDRACLQTVDMSSLYPSTICQGNLCTSTSVTHRQIMHLRDRLVLRDRGKYATLLECVDATNQAVLKWYRPVDIAVESWRLKYSDNVRRTMLEKKLGTFFDKNSDRENRKWCANKPPDFSIRAAGLEYFPEYACDADIQCAMKVNDDMHINPSDIEHMVPALPVLALKDERIVSHVTCGELQTVDELFGLLNREFSVEEDDKIRKRLYTFVGSEEDPSWTVDYVSERITADALLHPEGDPRPGLISLLDRIMRRVNAFDSAKDETLRKWTARMINVGSYFRAWNATRRILKGVIPELQARYKADRTVMQRMVKLYAESDPKKAEFNKVGEKTTKLCMNSIYGCFALRSNASRKYVSITDIITEGGVGGGVRHLPTANQITSVSRCVFGNIACAIQHALPNVKQVYGDTDSVFCVHNTPGDGEKSVFNEETGKLVHRVDTVMRNKMARLMPLIINASTKGILFDDDRDAGISFMKIAHERLAFLGFLFAKKTYHILHLKEGSKGSNEILSGSVGSSIDRFATQIECPEEYRGYVVPHNPNLIFAAARSEPKQLLADFLASERITDNESMKAWFTLSDHWLELNADVLYSLYISRMVDDSSKNWIDWKTSQPIPTGTDYYDAVSQAAGAFIVYKKGAFVKKSIPSSTKLKSTQSLFTRNLPDEFFDKDSEYNKSVKCHVKSCASFQSSPFMAITSSRVKTYVLDGKQRLPNPMAMMIHNHLIPNDQIKVSEKFLTANTVSAWCVSGDSRHGKVPVGYFDNQSVTWSPELMRGHLPGTVIKSLSVIPNTIKTILEMVRSDQKNIEAIISTCVNTLTTAASGIGFSLKKRALCFSTGQNASDILARAVYGNFVNPSCAVPATAPAKKLDKDDNEKTYVIKTLSTSLESAKLRIQRCLVSSNPVFIGGKSIQPNVALKTLLNVNLNLDPKVYEQLSNLFAQLETIRSIMNKNIVKPGTRQRGNKLDEMIEEVYIDFEKVLTICSERIVMHCNECPKILPDNRQESMFKKVLDIIAGKVKCTGTCVRAACQSFDFVLLYTLALRKLNEEKQQCFYVLESDIVRQARKQELVKVAFAKRFNDDLDAAILLFDGEVEGRNPAAMTIKELERAIRLKHFSTSTGLIYNPDDGRFFGGLIDRTTRENESLSGMEVNLPFVTGVYYREVLEYVVAKICSNEEVCRMLS